MDRIFNMFDKHPTIPTGILVALVVFALLQRKWKARLRAEPQATKSGGALDVPLLHWTPRDPFRVRDLLRSQDRMEWVIVSTGMFTSFLFEPAFGVVDLAQSTIHALGSWSTAVTVTTPADIGVLTAEIVLAEPQIVNSVVYTAGDTITYERLADIVDSLLGRKLQRVEWSVPTLKDELANDANNPIEKYRVVFAQGRGVSWEVGKTFNAQWRIDVSNVERWARENLKAWSR